MKILTRIASLAMIFTGPLMADSTTEGANPILPAPERSALPTIHIAPASAWNAGEAPTAAPGLRVQAYATGLNHPRRLYILPNGDVLVAETNAPAVHDSGSGLKGWIMKKVMSRAGAGVPSPDRITLLRGLDSRGRAVTRSVFLDHLHSPFGMTVVGNSLFVANTDAVLRFSYTSGADRIVTAGVKLADLPAGPINHHWTKDLLASPDGQHLYASVGSNSNVAESGIEAERGRACVYEIDLPNGQSRIFASGLRNPNGLSWEPVSHRLWVAVNERDELGNNLVPDYMTEVRQGGFYGWPYFYYGKHADERAGTAPANLADSVLVPDYALGAHTASLGLVFDNNAASLPAKFRGSAFVAQHGSWNRRPYSGYKVIAVHFDNGRPSGMPEDVLTGFLSASGHARGRPVSVVIDATGALLVADDVGNTIWRITADPANAPVAKIQKTG